jgi:hypothetical protein
MDYNNYIQLTTNFPIDDSELSGAKLSRRDRVLQRQRNLRSRNRRRHLVKTRWLHIILVSVHLQAKLPRLSIDNTSHPVRAAERLMRLQTVPRVAGDPVIPPRAELRQPRVLRFELDCRNVLHRILAFVPLDSNVVYWLLVQVLEHLRAELVGHFVLHVEFAVELRDNVDRVGLLDSFVLDLLLLLAKREDAIFRNVVAVAIG